VLKAMQAVIPLKSSTNLKVCVDWLRKPVYLLTEQLCDAHAGKDDICRRVGTLAFLQPVFLTHDIPWQYVPTP